MTTKPGDTFKKEEYVHLHGLGALVKADLEENSSIDIDVSEYDELGVNPVNIHMEKSQHKKAVQKLFEEITGSLKDELEGFSEENRKSPAEDYQSPLEQEDQREAY